MLSAEERRQYRDEGWLIARGVASESELAEMGGQLEDWIEESRAQSRNYGDTPDGKARFELPAGLHAGPISYKLREKGKQYLVIAPGGHIGLGSKLGDYVIAYTLP